jgi:hypothetical protein
MMSFTVYNANPTYEERNLHMGFMSWTWVFADEVICEWFICSFAHTSAHAHIHYTHILWLLPIFCHKFSGFLFLEKNHQKLNKFQKPLKGSSDFYTWFKQVANLLYNYNSVSVCPSDDVPRFNSPAEPAQTVGQFRILMDRRNAGGKGPGGRGCEGRCFFFFFFFFFSVFFGSSLLFLGVAGVA